MRKPAVRPLLLIFVCLLVSPVVRAATITVNTISDVTADDGFCTLREAIVAANTNTASGVTANECAAGSLAPTVDLIQFSIGSGAQSILVGATDFANITEPVTLDGTTQPGFSGAPLIEVRKAVPGAGFGFLTIGASNVTIRGFVIAGFQGAAIAISGSTNVAVEGNYLNTNTAGTSSSPAGFANFGVLLTGPLATPTTGARIGGTTPAQRNVIIGGSGINAQGEVTNLTISGNYIGIGVDGTTPLDPSLIVVAISISSNTVTNVTVGGSVPGARNVMGGTGAGGAGVNVASTSSGVVIEGNYIGVGADGVTPVPSGGRGILLERPPNVQIIGNVISAFAGDAIALSNTAPTSATIKGNFIGTAADGVTAIPNGGAGIRFGRNHSLTIGGTTAADRNIIVASQRGIWFEDQIVFPPPSPSATILGNYIGLGADGITPIGNSIAGIDVENGVAIIGDGTPGGMNVISSNNGPGIRSASTTLTVAGNRIGTDATGMLARPNTGAGISLSAGGSAQIGPGNVISGNSSSGILLSGAGPYTISGNAIGTDATVVGTIPNVGHGVSVNDACNCTIGGAPANANTIAFNLDTGVFVATPATGMVIIDNSIHDNAFLGIDLAPAGVTPNDVNDPDIGANNLQNFPTLSAAVAFIATTNVTGTLNSLPSTSFRIHYYSNPASDPAEGRTRIGQLDVTTDAAGNAPVSASLLGTFFGQSVTATATRLVAGVPVETSEFSAPVVVNTPGLLQFSPNFYVVNEGGGSITLTVTRGLGDFGTVTVNYATSNASATALSDYVGQNGTLTFLNGETMKTITIDLIDDAVVEPNEAFVVTLSGATGGAQIGGSTALVTITDNDPPPSITIDDVVVVEGNSGTTSAVFTVRLSTQSTQTVSVSYATADGTANAGTDYTAVPLTAISFSPGSTSQTVSVQVSGDTLAEPNETFFVNLSGATNGTITDNQGIGTIANDDGTPAIVISDASLVEGSSGTTNMVFTLTLSTTSSSTITVNYSTADVSATQPADYTQSNGTVTFNPSQMTQTISVPIVGDTVAEGPETFNVDLTAPINATIADNQATGTIIDDDGQPAISIDDITVAEGNGGTVTANFTVTLSIASSSTVTVNYTTANNTATVPGDYATSTATLTFAPGVTTQPIAVTVNGDTAFEADETYFVNLSGATNAIITDNQGLGTITNDDAAPAPTISINDVTVGESAANAVFTLTLSAPSGSAVMVNYATADGTASFGSDYANTSGTATFGIGATTTTVTVPLLGDTAVEGNETFFVDLNAPLGATIADNQGLGTIIDDDGAPQITINDATVTEGNAGTTNATFTVSLSNPSTSTVTVGFVTADGNATAGSDYAAATGTVTFAPGATTQPITILVTGDTVLETTETFFVNLSGPTNATIADAQGLGTITDDEVAPPPTISINDVFVPEGNAGSTNAVFAVTLSAPSAVLVTVDFGTANGTATAVSDYTTTNGTVTFAPGTVTQPINIPVIGDATVEGNETFLVNLTTPVNATIADSQGQGTIIDDDGAPSFSISDVTVTEGNAGVTNAVFTVTLAPSSASSVTVDFATANNTALAGPDYAASNGTLTFASGVTTQTITVGVVTDTLAEGTEDFHVDLSASSGPAIADAQGVGTIIDDDSGVAISINDASITEGNAGTSGAIFAVSLSAASANNVTVNYTTADLTASAGSDYTAVSGSLLFLPGSTTRTVTVFVLGDTTLEADEIFTVNLSAAVGATISRANGVGRILNDDRTAPPTFRPALTVSDVQIIEGDAGTRDAVLTFVLSANPPTAVSVAWATEPGTATSDVDYQSSSGVMSFGVGELSKTITIPIIGDTLDEADETFLVRLSGVVGADLPRPTATVTIVDDDDPAATRAFVTVVGTASTFRTSMQLVNGSGEAISGNLVFRPSGATNGLQDITFPFTLGPNAMREFSDLIRDIGASGIGSLEIRMTNGALPEVVTRVYSDGGALGTTGFMVPTMLASDALVRDDRGFMTAPSNTVASRFNIGVRALDFGATIRITLHSGGGAVLTTLMRTYAPNLFEQTTANDFVGAPVSGGDYIELEIVSGSAFIYGAWVDNVTQDPSVRFVTKR